ncbi:DUF6230 family protein [Nocardioides sp. Root151]|uniref:DUF6230 family protein n=2 Tax=Nocardioides TaxID=1839 RepID=UPI0007130956|nr:DUF6230 family protein [Nocardioides sp. Root151]KQY57051.1 hypothetical protein ASD30_12375 [Nocardioides sp. Root140]KQZ68561.1 hypothetical protein ASD66_14785 [Nocardioides sp. Root151]
MSSSHKNARSVRSRVGEVLGGRLDSARSNIDAMVEQAESTRRGTRRRALAPLFGGVAALAAMFSMVGSGVLAVNFTSANQSYKIYTDRVVGQYAAGYLSSQAQQSGSTAVAQIGFQQADLFGFCAIAKQTIGGVPVSLLVTGGEPVNGTVTDPSKKITANQLFMASNTLTGNGENISKMTLGQSADTLTMGEGNPNPGTPGAFGLQAELMQIANLDGDSYGIDLKGNINLPDLKIRVLPRELTKADCAS